MKPFRKSRPQNVSEWLEIATRKLSSAAKERIWTDVGAHYGETVERHLEQGLPTSAAHHAALAELGGAKAAARRFRREHLTGSEFQKVSMLLKSGYLGWVLHFFNLGGSGGIGVMLSRFSPLWLVFGMLVFAFFEIIIWTKRSTRWRILVLSWNHFSMGVLFLTIPSHQFWLTNALASILMLYLGMSYFRISNKLGHVAEDWMTEAGDIRNELPPEDPIAS